MLYKVVCDALDATPHAKQMPGGEVTLDLDSIFNFGPLYSCTHLFPLHPESSLERPLHSVNVIGVGNLITWCLLNTSLHTAGQQMCILVGSPCPYKQLPPWTPASLCTGSSPTEWRQHHWAVSDILCESCAFLQEEVCRGQHDGYVMKEAKMWVGGFVCISDVSVHIVQCVVSPCSKGDMQ